MKLFKEFLLILFITLISCLFPLGYLGLMFGFPSAILASLLLTFFYKDKLLK